MYQIEYLQMVVDTNLKSLWFHAVLHFVDDPALGPLATLNSQPYQLHQSGEFTFGPTDRIQTFDLVTPALGALFDYLYQGPLYLPQVGLLCTVYNQTCLPLGSSIHQPFANFLDCFAQATSLPIGTWDQTNYDSFICRIEQLGFVTKRPDLYCGWLNISTPNDRCRNRTYHEYWDETATYFPVHSGGNRNSGIGAVILLALVLNLIY